MKKMLKKCVYYLPRKLVTKIRYKYSTGKKLDLINPKDFNQKVIYLMLNEMGEKEQNCIDKYLVREYVKKKGLEDCLVKLYGRYESVSDIDFNVLPEEYVLKTNHGCGCTIIKAKDEIIDVEETKKELSKSLKRNYAKETLEYQYEKIQPCIICEQYLKESNKRMPTDYKIFCFNGIAKFLLVCGDRADGIKKVYYDLNWNKMDCTKDEQLGDFNKPKNFNEMIAAAEKLSEDFKFVRVDMYNIDGKIYFGELTFTPRGGINNTIKQVYLDKWGDMINLCDKN